MAQLLSPGAVVSVIDESFYSSSGPGTVPLIIIATQENKIGPDGASVAEGTLKENAGKLYTITSQRELIQTFGEPYFAQLAGTSLHGYELNEYGLLAAYSYLGIANRALIVRADVDTSQLEPSIVPPVAPVADGTYWMDLNKTRIGLSKWDADAGAWVAKDVAFLTDLTQVDGSGTPIPSYTGVVGSYVMVVGDSDGTVDSSRTENRIFRRDVAGWVLLDAAHADVGQILFRSHISVPQADEVFEVALDDGGEDYVVGDIINLVGGDSNGSGAKVRVLSVDVDGAVVSFELISSGTGYTDPVLVQGTTDGAGVGAIFDGTLLADGDYWIKTTSPNNGTVFAMKRFDGNTGTFIDTIAPLSDTRNNALLAYGGRPSTGSLFVQYDYDNESFSPTNSIAEFGVMVHNGAAQVVAKGTMQNPTLTGLSLGINGVAITGVTDLNSFVAAVTSANIPNITAQKVNNRAVITNTAGQDIDFVNLTGNPIAAIGLESNIAITNGYVWSNWSPFAYEASFVTPSEEPTAGALWYNTDIRADILVNNGQGSWIDYPGEVTLQPSAPFAPAVGDLWVDTDQLANYPVISRWSGQAWIQVDNADQTSANGILFQDSRPAPDFGSDTGVNNGGEVGFPDLDADAPDPLIYPKDILLWNSRYSTGNVKQWVPDYTYDGQLVGDRWVTTSGKNVDGSPLMFGDAVKSVITQQMASILIENQDIRAESVFFNLIACPGFPELIDEMVTLNTDKKEVAFILGDTPFTLDASGTSLQNWATNANGAASNGKDGLLTSNQYLGVYYPSAYTTNLDGQEVVTAASHIALRTYAYNDQVAYQWFAPAGFTRGVVTNAVNVGYVSAEGEFVPVVLSEGQRDVLYTNNINPIAFRPNRGLVVFGQKTRSPVQSAMDRVNVARLVNYIRYQAPQLAENFLFEPNDQTTRAAVTVAFERFLEELVVLRALGDFAVVCNETNNTPIRIDRNELFIDLLIVPLKSIEFIYIPVRIRNTGSALTL